jgi:hypothetical protein
VKCERQSSEPPDLFGFLLHLLQRGAGLALQEESLPERQVPNGSVGIELEGLAIRSLGLRVALDRQEHVAEVAVGVRPQRIALDGLFRQVDRFIPASEGKRLAAGEPERLSTAGFELERLRTLASEAAQSQS